MKFLYVNLRNYSQKETFQQVSHLSMSPIVDYFSSIIQKYSEDTMWHIWYFSNVTQTVKMIPNKS